MIATERALRIDTAGIALEVVAGLAGDWFVVHLRRRAGRGRGPLTVHPGLAAAPKSLEEIRSLDSGVSVIAGGLRP